jgi:hypothetical protein
MTNYSAQLRLALQETGENDGTWGDVANNGVFELLEDSIAGWINIIANTSTRTLTSATGSVDEARYAIVNITGTAGGADLDLNIPAVAKIYLVDNQLDGAFTVNIGVDGQTRAGVANGNTVFVWCDGTETFLVEVGNAENATNAALAADASALGGIAAVQYARLDVAQGFTAAQDTGRVVLSGPTNVAVNAALSNAFFVLWDGNWNLLNPTNPADGQTIRIIFKQGVSGGTITWGSQYRFPGGVTPTLSTIADDIDYAGFEYLASEAAWFGNLAKDFS